MRRKVGEGDGFGDLRPRADLDPEQAGVDGGPEPPKRVDSPERRPGAHMAETTLRPHRIVIVGGGAGEKIGAVVADDDPDDV